jgi:hypothetical protein
MTFKYAARRAHAWWKFWVFGKWIVYRTNQPFYVLTGFTKRRASELATVVNQLGSQE